MWKLLSLHFIFVFNFSIFACNNDELEIFFRDKYVQYLNSKFFFVKEARQNSFCESIKDYNQITISHLKDSISYFKNKNIEPGSCPIFPIDQLTLLITNVNEILLYDKMVLLCSGNPSKDVLETFFNEEVEKLDQSTEIGSFFHDIRKYYVSNRFSDTANSLKQLTCLNWLSSNSCQFDFSKDLVSLLESYAIPSDESSQKQYCEGYKDEFCKKVTYYLDPNLLNSGVINVTSNVGTLTFFRFFNSVETIGNSTDLSRICLYKSVSEKLNCDIDERTKAFLEYYQLSNLTNEDLEVTKQNCKKEGIAIENDLKLAKLKAYPNPFSLSGGQMLLKLKLINGEISQCGLRFKLFDISGREITIGDKFYQLRKDEPAEIDLNMSSLSDGIYFIRPIEAKCNEVIIKLPKENAMKLIILK
jgi:hypothetical protein